MESIEEFVEILKRTEVFVGLNDEELKIVAALPSMRLRVFEAGQVVSAEGDPAEDLYVLVDGKVELRLPVQFGMGDEKREITVDTVHKGSIFGWSALVPPYSFNRTSVCVETSTVLSVNGKELIKIMDLNEHIGYEIMRSIACVIASRLRTPNNYFWAELLKLRNEATRKTSPEVTH